MKRRSYQSQTKKHREETAYYSLSQDLQELLNSDNAEDYDGLFQDLLNGNDAEVTEELRAEMKISDDDDDALCALYELELYFFSKGYKSAHCAVLY